MDIVDDNSEFGLLIQDVVHKRIPAYIEGAHVFQTNGVRLKDGGRILKEITGPERNEPCFCGSGKKFKKCCINLI
jgi:uncharacterized protein YchJ